MFWDVAFIGYLGWFTTVSLLRIQLKQPVLNPLRTHIFLFVITRFIISGLNDVSLDSMVYIIYFLKVLNLIFGLFVIYHLYPLIGKLIKIGEIISEPPKEKRGE